MQVSSGTLWSRPKRTGSQNASMKTIFQSFQSIFNLHTAVFFSLQPLCLMHTGKPTGVAVPHCITSFQAQLILTTPPPPLRKHGLV